MPGHVSNVFVASPAYYGYYNPFLWGYSGWYPHGFRDPFHYTVPGLAIAHHCKT